MNEVVGVVAIGRNEGERLRGCLLSVSSRGLPVVYVDSGSTDGSVRLARVMGAEVVELDHSAPFSAARARNAGFDRLIRVAPDLRYVQFVDGDCEVVAGWIEAARQALETRPEVAVVCGRRRERFPERSVYNRLADLEWDRAAGEVESCGGDAMVRVEAFGAAGGFDPSVVAGEEPELCQRLRDRGWKILRLDAEMTLHDSAILRFAQWWRRQVRSGYGAADVAARFGRGRRDGLFVGQVRSARTWTVGWLEVLAVGSGVAGLLFGGVAATVVGMIVAAAIPAQVARLSLQVRPRVNAFSAALAYGALTVLGKWANLLGQVRYGRDRARGHHARLIEYKLPETRPLPSAPGKGTG